MGNAALDALHQLFQVQTLLWLALGVLVGMITGLLPGLSGAAGLALLLPLVYGLNPAAALAMMVGLLAVNNTTDTFPSVLIGVPGSSGSASTIMDGYPLAKKGQAGRALGASFTASMLGGLIGALALFLVMPIARPLIIGIGSPELFMLTLFGLSMVGILSRRKSPLKGLMIGLFGMLFSAIGSAPAASEYRFSFDNEYLSQGLPLVVVILGLFAVPELIELVRKNTSVAGHGTELLSSGRWQGAKEVFKHKWLVLRSSVMGVVLGAIPGLGGSASTWIIYGLTTQSYKDKKEFGKGDIRGVIGPEAANNSDNGGSLMPALLLGIPSGAGTAVLLGGLILIGVTPGPILIEKQPDLILVIAWSLALANVIGTAICFLLTRQIAKITDIKPGRLVPFLFIAIAISAYQASQEPEDLILLLAVGIFGWVLTIADWPRAPFLIGFVLGPATEGYLWISMSRYQFDWLLRPGVIAIGILILAVIWLALRSGSSGGLGSRWIRAGKRAAKRTRLPEPSADTGAVEAPARVAGDDVR
jgi:putative tricarboxylic transport membrane protein